MFLKSLHGPSKLAMNPNDPVATDRDQAAKVAYRPDIDGMRAVAVLLIVLFHAGVSFLPGGFVGVDIFFVISGFVITRMLVHELERTGSLSIKDFYVRRVRRLLPAGLLVCSVTVLFGFGLSSPLGGQQDLTKSSMAMVLFSSNIYFYKTAGYFDRIAELKPLLHTWSLAVEEQFYVVWPVLLLAIYRWPFLQLRGRRSVELFQNNRPPLRNVTDAARTFLNRALTVLALGFCLSLSLSVAATLKHPNFAFYMLPCRAWELSAGALVALAAERFGPWYGGRASGVALSVLGLGGVILSACTFDASTPFPGIAAVLPAASSAALITGGLLHGKSIVSRVLSHPILVHLGALSYSWYLWHWPLLAFIRLRFQEQPPSLLRDLLICGVTLGLAEITYRLIERPLRSKQFQSFATPDKILRLGVMLSAMMLTASSILWVYAKWISDNRVPREFAEAAGPPLSIRASPCFHDFNGASEDKHIPPADQCMLGTGDISKDPELLLWGDSHAGHLVPLLKRFADQEKIVTRTLGGSGCPPIEGVLPLKLDNTPAAGCSDFNAAVLSEATSSHTLKGLVISARWPAYLEQQTPDGRRGTIDVNATSPWEAEAVLQNGLIQLLNSLSKSNLRVLIVAASPEFRFMVPDCLILASPGNAEACSVSRMDFESYRRRNMTILEKAMVGFHNVRIWDPATALCDQDRCRASNGSTILYSDTDHLTAKGAVALFLDAEDSMLWVAGKK